MSQQDYPQYYEVQDPVGNVFALVTILSATLMISIQKREQRNSFIISSHATFADLNNDVAGQAIGVSPADYENILFDEWKFKTLPQEVTNATVCAGVELPVKDIDDEPAVTEPAVETPAEPEAIDVVSGTVEGSAGNSAPSSAADAEEASDGDGSGTVDEQPAIPADGAADALADDTEGGQPDVSEDGTGEPAAPAEPAPDAVANPEPVSEPTPTEPAAAAEVDGLVEEVVVETGGKETASA